MNNQYRISELSEKAGVTKRTIHYYLSRGLLPSPNGAGLGTMYSDEHLYRIILIKKLQDDYLPLNEIKKRINLMKLEDVLENLNRLKMKHSKDIYDNEKDDNEFESFNKDNLGAAYSRILVGFGVEIHYPVGYDKVKEFADKIYQYAENIMREG
ncbi:MAG: MerR family transcriptional regulator [Clostridiales bacterium]